MTFRATFDEVMFHTSKYTLLSILPEVAATVDKDGAQNLATIVILHGSNVKNYTFYA